jgi:glycosyltransferase involved in cell wall biosynthesis
MRIAIDARWIFPEISGIGAYTRELIRHLARVDGVNEYILLFHDPALRDRTVAEAELAGASNFTTQCVPHGVFSPLGQIALPPRLARWRVDLFHSTNYMMPLLVPRSRKGAKIKRVVTIHDLIPLVMRDQVRESKKARLFPLYRWLMTEIGARADAIVTDSRASAADIVRHLGIPRADAGRVRTIYCGVAERFRGAGPRQPKSGIEPRSILYVGRADPYKNLVVLIRAFAEARKTCAFPLSLVVAGAADPRYPEAGRLAAELGLADAVRWTGYLSDDELVALYQRADVLVHPSRYEGFGLQVLEAMACGTPVVCSNAASLPEIAGAAAILHSPDDVGGFAQSIARVLGSPDLAAKMSAAGLMRAAAFTWERAARETLAVYEATVRAQP